VRCLPALSACRSIGELLDADYRSKTFSCSQTLTAAGGGCPWPGDAGFLPMRLVVETLAAGGNPRLQLGRRTPRLAAVPARARPEVMLRLRRRAHFALQYGGLSPAGAADWRKPQSSASRCTLTCCAMPLASSLPTMAWIRGRCRALSWPQIHWQHGVTPTFPQRSLGTSGGKLGPRPHNLTDGLPSRGAAACSAAPRSA
jgi:hypothetical protein